MRINLFGGPGSGKSTTAARLFSDLKTQGKSIEHVGEYVKSWAYQQRKVGKFDQIYVFGKQLQYEYRFLNAGVKNIVTDSPLLLSTVYAPVGLRGPIKSLLNQYEKDFPSINVFIDRNGKKYDPAGRYQTEEQAKELDHKIWSALTNLYTFDSLYVFNFQEYDKILKAVQHRID